MAAAVGFGRGSVVKIGSGDCVRQLRIIRHDLCGRAWLAPSVLAYLFACCSKNSANGSCILKRRREYAN
jgi:hypothetical protein